MNQVNKFPLCGEEIDLEGSIIDFLTIQMQNGQPYVWAIVDPDTPVKKFRITAICEGWECNLINRSQYIGTIQDGDRAWHYFWEKVPTYRSIKEPELAIFSRRCR